MKVGIIGGGAAGFFTAINLAEKNPHASVTILEKSNKLLAKVKVSGGGRCNVTNGRTKPSELTPFYPRGGKKLYKPFQEFGPGQMRSWLQTHGVSTKIEADQRAFPVTDDSQTIIDCFLQQARRFNIQIVKGFGVRKIQQQQDTWLVSGADQSLEFEKLVVCAGASEQCWQVLETLGLETTARVPSLFTFNIADPRIRALPGRSFPRTTIKVAGTKLVESGPLLITHWGVSGPAVLKLSSRGAEPLHERSYQFEVIINLIDQRPADFQAWLKQQQSLHGDRQISNLKLEGCPGQYFRNLLALADIPENKKMSVLSKKELNKLTEELTQARFEVKGKSTFKEEFVTAGGVHLSEIDLSTMEAKRFPGLYLAGEVLNIDALTGGFNFQACWTGGWLISEHLSSTG